MSYSTTGSTGTGMGSSSYDYTTHENQIVAMYATDGDAQAAKASLLSHGVPASAIQVVSRGTADMDTAAPTTQDTSLWTSIRSLFVPDEDRNSFSHAIGHGHAMLVVTPTRDMDRNQVIQALEGTNPIDFDAKLQEWQKSGYDYSQPHEGYLASAQAMGGAAAAGFASGTGGMTGTASTGPVGGTMRTDTMAGTASTATPRATAATTAATTTAASMAPADDTVKVVEESLRVGKREVAAGAVRIRSYVVERPVEEQVRLREERVTIERHPVDRPATTADMGAFQERTIEARAVSEEPVVAKEARVVEEIGLRKEETERTETVRDTVRKTEVEIEDGTTVTGTTSTTGSTTGKPTTRR